MRAGVELMTRYGGEDGQQAQLVEEKGGIGSPGSVGREVLLGRVHTKCPSTQVTILIVATFR